jgi:hypothetical protein
VTRRKETKTNVHLMQQTSYISSMAPRTMLDMLVQCYQMFHFKKKYLRKLFTGLGVYTLPEWVRLDSGHLYHREMMFLLL